MAGRYGTGVYMRNLSVPSTHSATTLGGDHTFRHIEKKHYQRDQRKNRLLWRTCRPNSEEEPAFQDYSSFCSLFKVCTVVQVCLQNHLKKGFFLSNMHKRIIIVQYAEFLKENWQLKNWLHYFSKCESALHYFSKCESALHYFSKCESALH
jgi:hypothetical protein